MGATKLLNLERHRVEVLKAEVEQLKAAIRDNWGRDTLELATANASVNLCCRCSAVAVLPTAAQTDLCRPRRLRRLVLPASAHELPFRRVHLDPDASPRPDLSPRG